MVLNKFFQIKIGTLYLIFSVFSVIIGTAFSFLVTNSYIFPSLESLQNDYYLTNFIFFYLIFINYYFIFLVLIVVAYAIAFARTTILFNIIIFFSIQNLKEIYSDASTWTDYFYLVLLIFSGIFMFKNLEFWNINFLDFVYCSNEDGGQRTCKC